MALAVASTSTVTTNNADNLTINKPSGTVAGDLLILIASGFDYLSISCSGFSSSIESAHSIIGDLLERESNLVLLYKIAGASEPATYTIAKSGTETLGNACMLRVTGWTTGNPVLYYSSATEQATLSGTFNSGSSSLSLNRPAGQLLIMAQVVQNTDGATTKFSYASYQITSSDSNPTWTEVIDASASVFGSTDSATNHLAVAYAITTNTSVITAYQATLTETTADNNVGINRFLAVIVEPNNVTTDVSHLAVTPTIESVTASQVNVNPDVSHLAVTPTVNGMETTNSSDRTQWTNDTKPTTVWVNDSQ